MPVTFDDVLDQLDREEPAYQQAAKLGAEALPHLIRLIREGDPNLGSKATHLASFINAPESAEAVALAASHSEPLLRIAAAGSLARLSEVPQDVAERLLNDEVVGVRKWTLRALAERPLPALRSRVLEIERSDPESALRQLASKALTPAP